MTQKTIGPSFASELAAHGGLIGQHFTWHSSGMIEFFDDTPQSVIDGVNAVYAAHDPDSLAWAQSQQNEALSAACASAITSGFSSSALGSICEYPSTITDQSNQQAIAANASGGALWCKSAGAWSFKTHTQAQAQAVVASFATWLNKCQQQLLSLTGQVNAPTATADSIKAVVWVDPPTE